MSYQQILQKMTNDDFITESDDEIVAMWEGHHMAYHDSTTDQVYMASIHESYNMAMEDSKEASQVLEDTAMEIQWYKDMDESMEPAQDAWARYWHHHPRPGQEVPADQGADASRSTIPTAGAAAASSISIPKATAKAKSIGTSAKAKAPKVEATSSSASPANAMPGGAMPATSDAAASAPRPDGSSRPPEPAIPPRTSRPDAATNQARPAKSNYQTGWRAKMVWMLAMCMRTMIGMPWKPRFPPCGTSWRTTWLPGVMPQGSGPLKPSNGSKTTTSANGGSSSSSMTGGPWIPPWRLT